MLLIKNMLVLYMLVIIGVPHAAAPALREPGGRGVQVAQPPLAREARLIYLLYYTMTYCTVLYYTNNT